MSQLAVERLVYAGFASASLAGHWFLSPAARLSDAKEVVIVARVSRSGQAQPQAGALEGASARTRPGATGVVGKNTSAL